MCRWLDGDGANAGVVRHTARSVDADVDIVFTVKCTGGPTSGDHHERRSPFPQHWHRLGRRRADRPVRACLHLLQSGVPFNVIALWLGHESTTTTHRYVEADLAMKEKALARLEAPDTKMRRYRAPDALMRFLQTL